MTFIERMKELLDQGVQVSKGFATKAGAAAQDLGAKAGPIAQDIGHKAKDLGAKAGAAAQDLGAKAGPIAQDLGHKAKDLGAKAGAAAQDLGERGVLMFEIRQLEGQAQKLIGRLGVEAYQTFAERGETTLSAESAPIKAMLSEIATARASIEEKQAELKARKKK
ncbi:MAG: hypothetical protein LBQ94_10760 [Treponema sp.]|jgi:hypothetical protein|nr:hypothetical protein [Treponema sp.]